MVTKLPSTALSGKVPVVDGINVGEDDLTVYDEGTWTPTLSIGISTASPTVTNAKFTRVGNVVYLCARMSFSRAASATGAVTVGGLPVASSSSGTAVINATFGNSVNATNVAAEIGQSTTTMNLKVNSGSSAAFTAATYADAVDFAGFTINDSFTINVPSDAGGTGVSFLVITEGVDATGSASASANRIAVGCSSGPSAGTLAETVVDAINGFYGSGGAYNHSFASANIGVFTAAGVTATLSGSTKVSLTSTHLGTESNAIAVANVTGNAATNGSLSGAADGGTKVDFSNSHIAADNPTTLDINGFYFV